MKKLSQTLIIIALGMTLFSCQNKKSDSSSEPVPVAGVPTATNPDGTPGSGADSGSSTSNGGATTTFRPVSFTEFAKYVATHPLNDPKNFKINIDLVKNSNLRFSGRVQISYEDTGRLYNGLFESEDVDNVNYSGKSYDNGTNESNYNYWYKNSSNNVVFSGFFQDEYGAIVVTVDNQVNTGDASGTSYVSGTVWYKNFAQSVNPQSPYRKCWFLYDGPYICRSNNIINKSSLDPSDGGYRKLGTFSGLSKVKAFNL